MALYMITNDATDINFEESRDTVSRVLQNCHNLLMTHRGEIPFDRRRGLDPAIYDMPYENVMEVLMRELSRVMVWEPRAIVQEARTELRDDGTMRITCILNINERGAV